MSCTAAECDENFAQKAEEFVKLNTSTLEKEIVTLDQINQVIEDLQKNKNKLQKCVSFIQYTEFLSKYGASIYDAVQIFGHQGSTNLEEKMKRLKAVQRGFEFTGKVHNMSSEELKSCWVIGRNPEEDEFYIDASKSGRGHIYYIDIKGRTRFFTENFVEFMDKFIAYRNR